MNTVIVTKKMEIPGYTILRELGRGGMATVYLANQDKLHRQVALKVMRSTIGTDEDFTARFNKEGRIIAQLDHRQIVTIYDFNSYQNHRYFSMEYLPGGTLAERIQQGLPVEQTLATIRMIAVALSYAHKRGVIHRDLKPQNIMFHEDDTPVLMDFGIARVVNANLETTQLTQIGTAIGSPRYMSPEQITGQTVDARADLYSLGIVFFEMLTKELPYNADDVISLAMMHCSSPIPPLPDEVANFQSILDKLIAKKADDRFADATQFIQAIDEVGNWTYTPESNDNETRIIGSSQSFSKLTSSNTGRSRRRIGISSLFLLSVAVAVATYLMLFRSPKLPSQGFSIELPPATDGRSATTANYEKLAIAHFRQGELKRSMGLINLGLSVTPGDSRLQALRTKVQGDLDILKLVQKARSLQNEGEFTESLKSIVSGLEIIPDHADLLALRTEVQQDLQRQAEIANLLSEARELLQSNELDESLARVEKGLQLSPGHRRFLDLRSDIEKQHFQRRQDRAAAFLIQAREQQQHGFLSKAMELVENGLQEIPTDTALLDLKQTIGERIKLDHQVAQLIVDAQVLVDHNSTEKGLALVKRGLELEPTNEQLRELEKTFVTQQHLTQKRRADELLEQATILQAQRGLRESLSVVDEGLKFTPQHPGLLALRGQIAAQLEQRDHIARLLGECSSRFPLNLSLRDNAEAAIACYQQILDLDPQNIAAGTKQKEIANHLPDRIEGLLQAGDLENAENLIELVTRINPRHPELAALHRAQAAAQEVRLSLDLSQRRLVQTWLNALGYAAGNPDGAFGAKTRRAISAYQSATGMESTGFLNADVHALLEEQGSVKLRRTVLPEMADIDGGCFQMGSPVTEEARDNDERQHKVCIDSFRLGKREVTVKEFRRFVEATDYQTDAERNAWGELGCWALDAQDREEPWRYRAWANWRTPNKYQETRDDHPVTCVSWNDAQSYVDWLSRESSAAVRLPSEAEWEYAARAGTTSTRFWEAKADQTACSFASVADSGHQWADGFPCDDGHDWVAPVGGRQPNPWGLYDIFGNVWEWTCSAYDREYGGNEANCTKTTDIEAPRVLRGGSWYSGPPAVRAAYRDRNYLGTRYSFLGFRVAED